MKPLIVVGMTVHLIFCLFNCELVNSLPAEERVIAFDPSYLPKSGKHTVGAGYFWSGSMGKAEYGLEIGGFASIGMQTGTAMHLYAKQTVDHKRFGTLLEYYASLFIGLADSLKSLSSIIVADSYFARKPFVEKTTDEGFTIVSKLASNAVLLYPRPGAKTGKRGRPKKYDGRVDCLNPCKRHFKCFENGKGLKAFQGKAYIKAFGRLATCVIVHTKRKDGSTKAEAYFPTGLNMDGNEILKAYGLRFQQDRLTIEFLYRDAKQYTGLSQCQASSRAKIHMHINVSLTAVSLAKAIHHLPKKQRKPFSLSSIKNQYFNEHLLNRFFLAFGIKPEKHKKSNQYQSLYNYGCIAA